MLQERLSGDYPGLCRIVQLFDPNIIEIEFLQNYSNEIGLRFRKRYIDAKAENLLLKAYFSSSCYLESEPEYSGSSILAAASWPQLLRDTLDGRVFLPGGGEGYACESGAAWLCENLLYATDAEASRHWNFQKVHPCVATMSVIRASTLPRYITLPTCNTRVSWSWHPTGSFR